MFQIIWIVWQTNKSLGRNSARVYWLNNLLALQVLDSSSILQVLDSISISLVQEIPIWISISAIKIVNMFCNVFSGFNSSL